MLGYIELKGYGDPALGSWRYTNTTPSAITDRWVKALQQKNIKSITGEIITNGLAFSFQSIPGGWVWEDVGNYYGAGAAALNWRENQFGLLLKAGDKPGDDVVILETTPKNYGGLFWNELKTGKKGSGDNAAIYLPHNGSWLVKGTIPAGEKKFKISGAVEDPANLLRDEFGAALDASGILYKKIRSSNEKVSYVTNKSLVSIIDEYLSPSLDSINYWFLQKSVNLYGEAFVKTIAYEKTGFGSTDTGVSHHQRFLEQQRY
ncbi:MAG: D-alanyl-D-alanine carboxypeptidase [Ferruginibacter sp.]